MKDELSDDLKLAIVGMAGRFPGASSCEALWDNLRAGRESLQRFDRATLLAAGLPRDLVDDPAFVPVRGVLEDPDHFDAELFGISPREAEVLDPQQRVFLECAWHALEDAGFLGEVKDARVGVFAGVGLNTYLLRHIQPARERLRSLDDFQIMILNDKDTLPTRVAYKIGLCGPAVNVQTSCSTGLVAVHLAAQSLLTFDCDVALAGASAIKFPQVTGHRYQPDTILSPDGHCRAFDARAAGTVGGSGCGVVVLKRLTDAIADGDRIRAVIRGSAINNDGQRKVSYTAPSVAGQSEVIAAAHHASLTPPDTITFVEGHGTATPVGDPIELRALTQAFRVQTQDCGFAALGSIKTNIGHLDTASGMAGLIKTVLALEHREIPPTLHFSAANPELELETSPFFVNAALIPWTDARGPRRAGVSSFGVGGTNAHVVLEQAPALAASAPPRRPWQLLPWSAKTLQGARALEGMIEARAGTMAAAAEIADAAYTQQVGRAALPHRGASLHVGGTCVGNWRSHRAVEGGREVIFVCSGQGSQRAGMGRALLATEPAFREAVMRGADPVRARLDVDLIRLFSADPQDEAATRQLGQTHITQPALFVFEHALATLWQSWGVRPTALLGHSVGELVAACLAGVLGYEEALNLVIARGELMRALPPGAMTAVRGPAPSALPEGLAIAALNGPDQWVGSGPIAAIEAWEAELNARDVPHRRLSTAHAFHGAAAATLRAPFEALASAVPFAPPHLRLASCVTGTWMERAPDAAHWGRHLADPVRFGDAAATVHRAYPEAIWLEIGPGDTLTRLVTRHTGAERAVASCGVESQDEVSAIGSALARLWTQGGDIDWRGLQGDEPRQRISMPRYPFERSRYFVDGGADARPSPRSPGDVAEWIHVPTWQLGVELSPVARTDGLALAISDDEAHGSALVAALGATHSVCVHIGTRDGGERFEAELAEVIEEKGAPHTIVFAAPMTLQPHWPFERVQGHYLYPLMALARVIERKLSGKATRLVITTRSALAVGGEPGAPAIAPTLAAARVVAQELGAHRVQVVDSDETELSVWAAAVAQEAGQASAEPTVAHRRAQRWAPGFTPMATVRRTTASRLRAHGTYVILGGLGDFGLLCAQQIGAVEGTHVALVDVVPPNPERLAPLDAARVSYRAHRADVSDRDALRRVFDEVRAATGRIDGVIHAAGCAEALVPIGETTPEVFQRHFAAKVHGTEALADALGEAPVDFVVLVGSLASLLGGLGHAAYAASNAFLDAFAARRGPPWCSAAIETWSLSEPAETRAGGAAREALAMTRAQTEEVLVRIIDAAHHPRLIVAAGDLEARLTRWVRAEETPPPTPSIAAHPRPASAAPYVPPRTETEQRVSAIWSDVLGVAPVGLDDGFFDLGGDSLLATQVVARARADFAVELPLRRLFETPTLRSFCEVVTDGQRHTISAEEEIARLLDEVEGAPPSPPTTAPPKGRAEPPPAEHRGGRIPGLSVLFFSDDGGSAREHKYDLVLDAARFADKHGFHAIWTPERHFHPFGGLYPSPSVLGAALAAVTERIGIRAGSVVLPLHHPARVAEDWAVLDNLSGGRVGLAFAAGWVPEDFALGTAQFEGRRELVLERAQQVRRLWRGERLSFAVPGRAERANVMTYPRPVQDDLPIWITTSGSQATWEAAGRGGYRVLTGLLQSSLEQVEANIGVYRQARQKVGLDPQGGWVTLMMHTFVGSDGASVRQSVERPLKAYLANHLSLYVSQDMLRGGLPVDPRTFTEDDRAALADLAFERYFHSNGLFGTVEDAEQMLLRVAAAGVQEVGCLLDYGIAHDDVLSSLELLATLIEPARRVGG